MFLETVIALICTTGTLESCSKGMVAYGKQTGYSDVIEAYSDNLLKNTNPLLKMLGGAGGIAINRRIEIGLTNELKLQATPDISNITYSISFD